MDGTDAQLAAQLQKVGFASSRRVADESGPPCDAVVNAELVELSGRSRKTARIDFRLTVTGEEPPRISSTAVGKSADHRISQFASGFRPAESTAQPEEIAAQEAVLAAIEQQAIQIRAAYQRGLPPWLHP